MKRIVLSSIAFITSGCLVGPDFEPPKPELPAQFTEAAAGAEVELGTWWKELGDPVLESLIEAARRANPDLKIAVARIREARALSRIAGSDLLPSIDTKASVIRSKSPPLVRGAPTTDTRADGGNPFGFGRPLTIYDTGFDAIWELDFFGATRREMEAADAALGQAQENYHDVLISLYADVARNYIAYTTARTRLDVAQKNLESQNTLESLVRERYEAGITNALDLAETQALTATLEAVPPIFESSAKDAFHRLGALLVLPAVELEGVLGKNVEGSNKFRVPAVLPAELLRRRPDIRRAELAIHEAVANIGVATSDLFPKISLTGGFGYRASSSSELYSKDAQFWSIGPALDWPILSAREILVNVEANEARHEQSVHIYEKTVVDALAETESSFARVKQSQRRVEELGQAVQSQQTARELAKTLYLNGVTDLTRVLDIERDLFVRQDQFAESRGALMTDVIALYKALGGGWEPEQRPEASQL